MWLESYTEVGCRLTHVRAYVRTLLQDSERRSGKRSLLAVVLAELESRLSVKTVDGEAQTMIDCFDHRIALGE